MGLLFSRVMVGTEGDCTGRAPSGMREAPCGDSVDRSHHCEGQPGGPPRPVPGLPLRQPAHVEGDRTIGRDIGWIQLTVTQELGLALGRPARQVPLVQSEIRRDIPGEHPANRDNTTRTERSRAQRRATRRDGCESRNGTGERRSRTPGRSYMPRASRPRLWPSRDWKRKATRTSNSVAARSAY